MSHHIPQSFTELLALDEENEAGQQSYWESFSSHFTQEFEMMKAEMEGLRGELKNLKKVVKDLKANQSSQQENQASVLEQQQQTRESQLMLMVKNTTKPLEGLKALLFELFTPDEVRLSSLKGRTTVAGGESVGLQREKLNMIYYVMEQRYEMERNAVDNLIRNQQRKLREQFKKLNNS